MGRPRGVSWESWVDRQIREGLDRGEFDGLAGHGRPIADIDRPADELWWVRRKLRDEGVASLPPALALRKERDDAMERIARAEDEDEVRRILTDINDRIRRLNTYPHPGPPSTLVVLDIERVVGEWRSGGARPGG